MRLPVISQGNQVLMGHPQRGPYVATCSRRYGKYFVTCRCAWSMSSWFALFFTATFMIPYLTKSGYNVLKMVFGSYLLWFLFLMLSNKTSFKKVIKLISQRKNESIALLGWLMVVLFNAVAGRGFSGWFQAYHMMFMFLFITMNWAYSIMNRDLLNGLRLAMIIILGIQAAISLPTLYEYPKIAREVMLGQDNKMFEFGISHGVGEYGLYTSLAIGFPMILLIALSMTGIKRILGIASCIAIFFSIFLSTFTGASSLALTGLVLLMITNSFSSRFSLKRVFLIFTLICLFGGGMFFLRDIEQVQFVQVKAEKIISGVFQYGIVEGDYSKRGSLALGSLTTFFQNPFFGVGPSFGADNYEIVGAHSSWIDGLAEYGLFGFGFYIFFLGTIFVQIYKDIRENQQDYFAKARCISLFLFLIGGTINPVVFNDKIVLIFFFFIMTRPHLLMTMKTQSPRK